MFKFDNLYNLLIEEILNTENLIKAKERLEKDQKINNNPYFDELRKEFNQLSNEVINFNSRNNIKVRLKRTLNRILERKGIQNSFLNPIIYGNTNRIIFTFLLTRLNDFISFNKLQNNIIKLKDILDQAIQKIKTQYPSEISNAIQENNKEENDTSENNTSEITKDEKAINKVSSKLISLDEKIKNEFIKQLLNLTKISKQSSTSTGRGQLLLTLLIKGASFTGIDDIKINGENYNIKFLDRKDGALISIPQESFKENNLNSNNKNQFEFKNINNINEIKNTLNITKFINITENNINNVKNYIINKSKKILQQNTVNVDGYILILNTKDGIIFKVLKTSEIIKDPLKYLMSIKFKPDDKNTRSGFYFKNDDISFTRLLKTK